VPGVAICEHLPKLARCADKFAILRGVSHSLAAHELGSKYMNTGNRPIPSLEFPGYGAGRQQGAGRPPDLPPSSRSRTRRRSPATAASSTPRSARRSPEEGPAVLGPRDHARARDDDREIEKRRKLLTDLDRTFRGLESDSDLINGLDRFSQRAYDIISSPRTRQAFDVGRESPGITGLFATTRSRRAACWPRGSSRRASGSGPLQRRLGHARAELRQAEDTLLPTSTTRSPASSRPSTRRACLATTKCS